MFSQILSWVLTRDNHLFLKTIKNDGVSLSVFKNDKKDVVVVSISVFKTD